MSNAGLAASRPSDSDVDLAALATEQGHALARACAGVVRDVWFDEVNRDLRLPEYGGDYEIRPFPLPNSPVGRHEMKARLRDAVRSARRSEEAVLARRIRYAFSFFMFGEPLNTAALSELFGPERRAALDEGMALGLFVRAEGQTVRMSGLSLFSKKLRNGAVICAFADTPPHFDTRLAEPRVYIGADSYELAEGLTAHGEISGACVDMGSGSGIQLIAALKRHPSITQAIGVECDKRARHVSLFNAALNGVGDRIAVVPDGDELRQVLDRRLISLATSNPPFIAMPVWIGVAPEDRAWFARVTDVRDTDRGPEADLRQLFPAAGWGGEDGLCVTRSFVDTIVPLLAPRGRMVIYSQFAGDANGPAILAAHVQSRGDMRLSFEPVTPRTLVEMDPTSRRVIEGTSTTRLTAHQAASAVARLIVAAIVARNEPQRRLIGIRKDGPEYARLLRVTEQLEDSYRRQGITHFHDGFGVLTTLEAGPKEH
jgi:methylase of polypeptide subunit release factors